MSSSVERLRREIFAKEWPLDPEITATAATLESHRFLTNPAAQYSYIYLTRFIKALAEQHFGRPFDAVSVLDWGCGKGQVSKMITDLHPQRLDSCDLRTESQDSAFGQQTPIIERFGIQVKPLEHVFQLPYDDASFDVVLSVGVLEHVANDAASLNEIQRILKPGGLFFCFFLPTVLSWTQKLAHLRGDFYHDRFYSEESVKGLLQAAGLKPLDIWFRAVLPKNTIQYPSFRTFERFDHFVTEHTPFKHFATNIEFVSVKPALAGG